MSSRPYQELIRSQRPALYWPLNLPGSSDYRAAVLTDVPTDYWRLTEATGTRATDLQGHDNGTYTGTVTLGQAAPFADTVAPLFDGSSGYVAVPSSSSYDFAGSFTLEAWIYLTDLGASYTVMSKGSGAGFAWFFNTTNNKMSFFMNAAMATLHSSSTMAAGVWTHVAVKWNGTNVTFYKNGQPDGAFAPSVTTQPSGAGTLNLGSSGGSSGFFKGRIAEAAVYKGQALSDARVAAHYAPAAVASDLSPNGIDGTYTNGPTRGAPGAIAGDSDPSTTFASASSQYAVANSNPAALQLPQYTVGFWMNVSAYPGALQYLVQRARNWQIWINPAGTITSNYVFLNAVTSTGTVPLGRWSHVVVTCDGTNVTIYINGLVAGTGTVGGALDTGLSQNFAVARDNVGLSNYLDGSLDEVAVFGRVLTPAEILAQYKAGTPSLVALDPVLSPPVRMVSISPQGVTYELSPLSDNISYSNVNPGGDETASFTYHKVWGRGSLPELQRGNILRITAGLDVVWQGRIEETDRSGDTDETITVTAYGLGNRLKDSTMRMVYVDRDLDRWQGPSSQRKINLINAGTFGTVTDPETTLDTTTGSPAVNLSFTGTWAAGRFPIAEAWYDAGPNLQLDYFYIDARMIFADVTLSFDLGNSSDDLLTAQDTTTNSNIATFLGYVDKNNARFARLSWYVNAIGAGGNDNTEYYMLARKLTVYGNHGLTRQGSDPGGFTADQIIRDVLGRASSITARNIDSQSYVIPHFVVTDPTSHEDVIRAAADTVLVDWGTWGPTSPLDNSTTGYFDCTRKDTTTQHWFALRAEASDLSLQTETATLYNRVDVTYTDASGTQFLETRSTYVEELDRAGIIRTYPLDAGLTTQAQAQSLGDTFLAIFGGFAPARGSASYATPIKHYRKGKVSPVYMKADGSNIRVPDVLPSQTLFALDSTPDRRATFPIQHVEVDLASQAVPVARVDLDQTSDALSSLLARLALEAQYSNVALPILPDASAQYAARNAELAAGGDEAPTASTSHHHHRSHRLRNKHPVHHLHNAPRHAPGGRRRHH